MRVLADVVVAIHGCPVPVVAKVDGLCVGAGLGLALAADLTWCSDRARFSAIFAKRGLSLDFGTSWLLRQRLGAHRAKELAFTGKIIGGAEALDLGLVNAVVPADELDEATGSVVDAIAAGPPLALSMTKRQIDGAANNSLAQALEIESLAQSINVKTDDMREALVAWSRSARRTSPVAEQSQRRCHGVGHDSFEGGDQGGDVGTPVRRRQVRGRAPVRLPMPRPRTSWSDRRVDHRRRGPGPLEGAVDRRDRGAEELGGVGGGVAQHLAQHEDPALTRGKDTDGEEVGVLDGLRCGRERGRIGACFVGRHVTVRVEPMRHHRRSCPRRTTSKHVLVAMHRSHQPNELRPSKLPRRRHARSNASCTASSASGPSGAPDDSGPAARCDGGRRGRRTRRRRRRRQLRRAGRSQSSWRGATSGTWGCDRHEGRVPHPRNAFVDHRPEG